MATAAPPSVQPKPFLTKLYKMVDEPETDSIVSWTPAGDALVVHDDERFAQQLLPLHFKHNNFSSFVRQLNTYGFSKVDPDRWIFAHLHFRRDARESINLIQRKSSHRPSASAATAVSTSAANGVSDVKGEMAPLDAVGPDGVADAVADGQSDIPVEEDALHAELQAIRGHHQTMATRIRELNSQLQQTKAQQANTRESIGKIVAFLSQVYHSAAGRQGSTGGAVTFDPSSVFQSANQQEAPSLASTAMSPAKRPRLETSVQPSDAAAAPAKSSSQAQKPSPRDGGAGSALPEDKPEPLPALLDIDFMAPATASSPVSEPMLPLPKPQISLGEEAARTLPDDLQEVAMHLYSNPDLQDAVLEQVQSGISEGVEPPEQNEDIEAFLWDFLEANQDNVDSRVPADAAPAAASTA
mmetsp:Transcript_38906/g.81670  ORF Transcript_38906/g.81670 Transcript_38906/m.81670 type:complete len:412 (+) Transcript_38906:172-1407(+)